MQTLKNKINRLLLISFSICFMLINSVFALFVHHCSHQHTNLYTLTGISNCHNINNFEHQCHSANNCCEHNNTKNQNNNPECCKNHVAFYKITTPWVIVNSGFKIIVNTTNIKYNAQIMLLNLCVNKPYKTIKPRQSDYVFKSPPLWGRTLITTLCCYKLAC